MKGMTEGGPGDMINTGSCLAEISGTLTWKIPWMEEPGGLQSMGSQRVGYD